MSKTETMEIKHRYTGAVLFSARVDVSLSDGLKIGAAVKLAIKADATLAGANLADANLAGANLARANGLLDCGSPYSWRVVIVAHTDGIRISARCRWMTFEEATARWKKRGEERALMLPLLAYVKAAAKIKGWKL